MTDLRSQLQHTLGNAYTLDRELGGGGMSRVFVAEDTSLARQVVVKVLAPDLAAGLNVDRFRREIQTAAKLQHPQIVPVLTTGETDGLPYYTMPFVAGESLRQRLAGGPLGIAEAVGVLRDVARALAFAHKQGIVHRDIKPENVLLSEGSAAVTDFGIAKAISAARGSAADGRGAESRVPSLDVAMATLTQVGTSLGTPAYMAPEQVAGDPNTDHRADLYAFGAMAYELLTGRPPFTGPTPQKVLASHLAEAPQPVQELRADVPHALADLVMRCLAKDPGARPLSAAQLLPVLDGSVSTGEGAPMPAILLGGVGMWKKALAYYAVAFVAVAVLARAAIVGIGLPDWVFPGALLVMGLGLPVILVTAYVHRVTHRALVTTPVRTPTGGIARPGTMATLALKASPHLSWRRAATSGMWAVGSFVALVGGWMAMRALGIGPAASLMAAGKLGERERVIVADFGSPAGDSLLGGTVAEAFRTDLAQSANLSVLPATAVQEVLRRMQRSASSAVTFELAREIAAREGIKAVLDGDVVALGGYVISARLVAAQTGDELATFRETAEEQKDIIPAISRLSKQVRSKVGESLRTVQKARTLEKVTTPSLQALQKYVAGLRAIEAEGDFARGSTLLAEAFTIDTGFAMAYRKLAIELRNRGLQGARADTLFQKAYDHRDRLSDSERYITIGSYFSSGPLAIRDADKSTAAYESLLEIDSTNTTAINNLAVQYRVRRDFVKAERMYLRGIALDATRGSVQYTGLLLVQLAQGKLREADQTVSRAVSALPAHPAIAQMRAGFATTRGRYDSAAAILDSLIKARPNDAATRRAAAGTLALLGHLRGQLKDAAGHQKSMRDLAVQLGNPGAALAAQFDEPFRDLMYRGNIDRGRRAIERITASPAFDSLRPAQRNYPTLVTLYSLVGDSLRARAMYQAWERIPRQAPPSAVARHRILGDLAMAERRYQDAAREYTAANDDQGSCVVCDLPPIAYAYDAAGQADSAIAIYSRYSDGFERPLGTDATFLALALRRLAELHDGRGDARKALSYYGRFVELWKDADPDLQPQVTKVRARMAELQRRQG